MSAPMTVALLKSAPVRSAALMLVGRPGEPEIVAPVKFAPLRSAPPNETPSIVASEKSAPERSALDRFTSVSVRPLKSVPARSQDGQETSEARACDDVARQTRMAIAINGPTALKSKRISCTDLPPDRKSTRLASRH